MDAERTTITNYHFSIPNFQSSFEGFALTRRRASLCPAFFGHAPFGFGLRISSRRAFAPSQRVGFRIFFAFRLASRHLSPSKLVRIEPQKPS
jgi:hypothetical protein